MPGQTPNSHLPYPVPADGVDVPRDVKALADALDGAAGSGATAGLVPSGCIMMWPVAVAPTGWFICDGTSVPAAANPNLALVLGSTAGQINLPNLKGRVPLGVSPSHAIGSSGGAETVQLTPTQTPLRTHNHNVAGNTAAVGEHTHEPYATGKADESFSILGDGDVAPAPGPPGQGSWGIPYYGQRTTAPAGAHGHAVNINSGNPSVAQADGAAHENMPPFLTVNYIIKGG